MILRLLRFFPVFVVIALCVSPRLVAAQNAIAATLPTQLSTEKPTPKAFYEIVALGTSEKDSLMPYPVPFAFLRVLDPSKHELRVRFPQLGLLGLTTDTIANPERLNGDSILAFRANDPLLQLTFPQVQYGLTVDVLDRQTNKLIESHKLPYAMNLSNYQNSSLTYIHKPTTGMGQETLRREFTPNLLPFRMELNPGWRTREEIDTNGIYSLTCQDPRDERLQLSLTLKPTGALQLDSAQWEAFKLSAKAAFGAKGIAVNQGGDFQVADQAAKGIVLAAHEFLAEREHGVDYVAAYLTPRAIMLLVAPLPEGDYVPRLEYLRAIARSMKL